MVKSNVLAPSASPNLARVHESLSLPSAQVDEKCFFNRGLMLIETADRYAHCAPRGGRANCQRAERKDDEANRGRMDIGGVLVPICDAEEKLQLALS